MIPARVFDFVSFEKTVPEALAAVGAAAVLARQRRSKGGSGSASLSGAAQATTVPVGRRALA